MIWQDGVFLAGFALLLSVGGDLLVRCGIVTWRAVRDTRTYWQNGRDEGWTRWSFWKLPFMFLEMLWDQQCAKWNGHTLELLKNKPKEDDDDTERN